MKANNYPAVSVIIPVYKVEKYLLRCVNSVLTQSFTNYEIILVDDGSPDNCPTICDDLSQNYEMIKVVHKKNGGLASARNAGMNVATGKYIFFLDSDDWIEPDTLKEQYLLAEKENVDFIRTRPVYAGWPNHSDGEVCVFGTEKGLTEGKYDRNKIEKELLPHIIATNRLTMGPIVSAWGGLYRFDFLKKNNLKFYESIKYSEDLIFNVHATLCANSFYYIDSKHYYNYFYNSSSITKAIHLDIWENDKEVIRRFDEDFGGIKDYDFSNQLRYNKIFYILDSIGEIKKETDKKKRKRQYDIICNDQVTVNAFKSLNGLDISYKLRIVLYLIKFRLTWILARV